VATWSIWRLVTRLLTLVAKSFSNGFAHRWGA
jgi:hypothetical protein